MRNNRFIMCLIALLSIIVHIKTANADLYKIVDEQGRVIYTRELPEGVRPLLVILDDGAKYPQVGDERLVSDAGLTVNLLGVEFNKKTLALAILIAVGVLAMGLFIFLMVHSKKSLSDGNGLAGGEIAGSDGIPDKVIEVGREEVEKWFIEKLIAGDLGLGMTYWSYGVLGGIVLAVGMFVLFPDEKEITRGQATIWVLYYFLVYIGIWNASNKYSGSKVWSVLAKFSVIIGVLLLIAEFRNLN